MNQDEANALIFPKAKKFARGRVLKHPVFIEEKLDGHRYMVWKGHAYGRNLNKYSLRENRWNLMPDSVKRYACDFPVDGEVVWRGHESTDVLTGMKANCDEIEHVGFRLPDSPIMNQEPQLQRKLLIGLGYKVPVVYCDEYVTMHDDFYSLLKDAAERLHFEGWILKESTVAQKWWKLKLEWTYDLVVMGWKAGKGKYDGSWGALICGLNGKEIVAVGRSSMTKEAGDLVTIADMGRVMEIKCNGICSKGSLRHPRFKQWRDDKTEADCLPLGEQG